MRLSTSESRAIDVSPGVVIASAPCAAPQFTAVLGDWKTGEAALQVAGFVPDGGVSRDDGLITGRKSGKK